jgi:small GTP-binding protein
VDITNSESFALMKELYSIINPSKFPYLKSILVQNKTDLENTRQVTSFEIKEYLGNNSSLDSQEISLKNGENIEDLINKINEAENQANNKLPTNIVSESLSKKFGLMHSQGTLSFILIGDMAVGKTAFLTRYFKNTFSEIFLSTIGIDKEINHLKVGNDIYKMTLWDTAGQDRFRCLPKKYYQNADGVFLLFDVNRRDTFENVTKWMKDVKDNSSRNINSETGKEIGIPIYLIGNKIDKPNREISREEAEKQAQSLGMKYFEVSCKINMNINEVICRMVLETLKNNQTGSNFQLKSGKSGNNKKGGCCGDGKKKDK